MRRGQQVLEADGEIDRGREEDLVESKLKGAVWKCRTKCGR
jgi:hypothetical protein